MSVIPLSLVACPRCARQPGEACVGVDGRALSVVHAERVEAAAFVSGELEDGKNVVITDEAILGTGLV